MPSRHTVLSSTRTRPSARRRMWSWASGGGGDSDRVDRCGAIVRWDPDVGVEVEVVELGLTRAAGGDVSEVRLGAEAADASAGPWPQRDAALDGGPDEAGQDRRDLCERVRRRRVVGGRAVARPGRGPAAG